MSYERVHRPGYIAATQIKTKRNLEGDLVQVASVDVLAPSAESRIRWIRDYIYTRRGLEALFAQEAQEKRKSIYVASSLIAVRQCEELADLGDEAFHYPQELREALGTPKQYRFFSFDTEAQAEAFGLPDDLHAANQEIKDQWMRIISTHGEELLLQEAKEQVVAHNDWKAGLAMRERADVLQQRGKKEEARSALVQADLLLRDALSARAQEDSIEAEVESDTIVEQRADILWRAADEFCQLPPCTQGEREDLAYVLTRMPGMLAPKGCFGIRVTPRELDEHILRTAETLKDAAPRFSDLRRGTRQFVRAWKSRMELNEGLDYYGALINPPNPQPQIRKGLSTIASTLPDQYR